MCLAVPGRIISIDGDTALIDYEVERRRAKLLESSYRVGQYVIVQAGIVLQKVPSKEARAALKLYKEATREPQKVMK